jgi:hypothetical protein
VRSWLGRVIGHTSKVQRRRALIPLGLVGALTVVAIVAAVLGANEEPSAPSDPEAVAQLHGLAERTIDAKSFTEEITISGAGSPGGSPIYAVYNSPDRFELFQSNILQPWIIDVGSYQYTVGASDSGWTKIRFPPKDEYGRREALGFLSALSRASSVESLGDALVTTSIETTSGSRSSVLETTSTVHAVGGYISDVRSIETSTERGWKDLTFDARFSEINASPTVTIPTH